MSSTVVIFFCIKVFFVTLKTSTSSWLIKILQMVVVDYPGIDTELVLLGLIPTRGEAVPQFSEGGKITALILSPVRFN